MRIKRLQFIFPLYFFNMGKGLMLLYGIAALPVTCLTLQLKSRAYFNFQCYFSYSNY
jgi:hypothetical protein